MNHLDIHSTDNMFVSYLWLPVFSHDETLFGINQSLHLFEIVVADCTMSLKKVLRIVACYPSCLVGYSQCLCVR